MSDIIIDGDIDFDGDIIDDKPVASASPGSDVIIEDATISGDLPDRARLNEDGTVTLSLRYPQTLTIKSKNGIRDDVYKDLRLHRFNGADLSAIAAVTNAKATATAMGRSMRISAAIAGALFDCMDGEDIADMAAVIAFFTGSGRKTGRSA